MEILCPVKTTMILIVTIPLAQGRHKAEESRLATDQVAFDTLAYLLVK